MKILASAEVLPTLPHRTREGWGNRIGSHCGRLIAALKSLRHPKTLGVRPWHA